MVDAREGLYEHSGFKGLRNNVDATGFELGDLEAALNVDLNDVGQLLRRKGTSAPVLAGVDRDLWASGSVCLGVGGNALKRIHPGYTTTTLRTGLTAARALSYASVGDRVFYTNGVETGCVQEGAHRTWGLTVPGVFDLATASGTLPAGRYQVAITYIRSDGQESGARLASVLDVPAAGGVALTNMPVSADPTVVSKRVYLSSPGGEALYLAGAVSNAMTSFAVRELRMGSAPLTTQFLSPPPAGDHIAYFNGYMLVAVGNRLYPSIPYGPELFDLRKAIPVLDHITLVSPAEDGVWVGTESQVLWFGGDTPDRWAYRVVAEYGVIPGTLSLADGDVFGSGDAAGSLVALFTTKNGICAGRNGGAFSNLTQSRFAFPAQPTGVGVCRKHRGLAQYLVTLKGSESAANVAV